MSCPTVPVGKTREAIKQTVETGNEHGFVRCGDGSVSDIVQGEETNMDISEAVEECDLDDGKITVVHTHPNGVKELSKQDRQVAAQEEVESVCVAVEGGKVHCETVDNCEREVKQ